MDKKTKEALLESIEHWHQNLNMLLLNYLSEESLTEDIKIKATDCALCKLFLTCDITGNYCNNCPIGIKTKVSSCENSPYREVADWYWDYDYFYCAAEEFKNGCKVISAELEFLYSLLDKD